MIIFLVIYVELKVCIYDIITIKLQRKSDGQSITREELMVMLANVQGFYIRASYSNEGRSRAM